MSRPKPKYYEVDISRAIRAAKKEGWVVEIRGDVIRCVPEIVDSGENHQKQLEEQPEGYF